MKATAHYFPVVLFVMLYKLVPSFECVDEIRKCDHSNKATEQNFPKVLPILFLFSRAWMKITLCNSG